MVDGEKLECNRDVLSSSHFFAEQDLRLCAYQMRYKKEIISPNCVKCAQFGEKLECDKDVLS